MNNINNLNLYTLCGALLLSACQNYEGRHEGYSSYAGDARAINEVKMVEDPWKQSANNNQINTDGRRAGDAVEIYKSSNDPEEKSADDFGNAASTSDIK